MRTIRKRRTKKAYQDLHDDPTLLLRNCEVILYPNGENEIWVRSKDWRRGFKITGGDGPAGLMLDISSFTGSGPLSATGNLADEHWTPSGMTDFKHLSVVQYRDDDWSQRFKAWCADTGNPKTVEHPGDAPERVDGRIGHG